MRMSIEEIKKREQELAERERNMAIKLGQKKQAAFNRFPLVFTLLGAFGLVATFYGFERLIDKVQYFSDNPLALLITGVSILILTGSLYKKLQ